MEQQIIVLIDSQERAVRLFGKYNRVIPFSMAFVIPSLLAGQEVLYVTAIEAVAGDDVVNVLTYLITEEDQPTEKLYIRSLTEGYVRIPELKLTFSGPKDAKPIDNYGWDLFDRSPTLKKLLMDDKIEVLTESRAKALRKHRPDAKSKDKALDSILLNRPVAEILDSQDMFGPGEGDGDEVSEESGEKVLTENEMIMRQYGSDWGKDRKKKDA